MKKIDLSSGYYDDSAFSVIKNSYDKNILYNCVLEKSEPLHFYSKTYEESFYKQISFATGKLEYVWNKLPITSSITIPTNDLKRFSNHFNLEFFQDHKHTVCRNDMYDKYYDNIIVRNPEKLIERHKDDVYQNALYNYNQIAHNAILKDIENYIYNYLNRDILYKPAILIDETKVMGIGSFNYFIFEKYGYKNLVCKEDFNALFLAVFNLVAKKLLKEGRIIDWYPLSYDYNHGGVYLIEDKTPKRELKKWY